MEKKACLVPECDNPAKCKGLCGMHYQRRWKTGTTDEPPRRGRTAEDLDAARMRRTPPRPVTCKHPDRKHSAKGMCASCYSMQWQRDNPDRGGNVWLKENPDKARVMRRRAALKVHGITPERYAEMWDAQDGKCANGGCAATFPRHMEDYRSGLHVDHDHASLAIRGLLCGPCNKALGCVEDNVERLAGLIDYLRAHATTLDRGLILN